MDSIVLQIQDGALKNRTNQEPNQKIRMAVPKKVGHGGGGGVGGDGRCGGRGGGGSGLWWRW